ncbi:hypothetical protein IFM89_014876 [Coptis chinensis]|uniref:Uncharacterized protein n=1 Tax=Coptis chinensis TaxID=261450 RepID=A0A835IAU8_9MAGN|nr:hypothetical protein IFM89_014876 [Coptis chinensis]
MPHRRFLSPVYVPPMGVPGYSNNLAYPHPSNGNGYLRCRGSSQLAPGGLKYGASQHKPIPAGTPTGFGSYSNPAGYTLNAQGTVGGATDLDDSTRMKYKDGNIYVPNPQVLAEEGKAKALAFGEIDKAPAESPMWSMRLLTDTMRMLIVQDTQTMLKNLNSKLLSGRVPAVLGGRLLYTASFKYATLTL